MLPGCGSRKKKPDMSRAFLRFLAAQPCLFRQLTGFFCPGCGGTRAFLALLKGRLVLSFCYHPLILYCVVLTCWILCSRVLSRRKGKTENLRGLELKDIYGGIAVITINFLIKNMVLAVTGVDLLAILPPVSLI